jgi:hypothetical protein
VVEVFVAHYPDCARLSRPAQIDLKPSSSRTTNYLAATSQLTQTNAVSAASCEIKAFGGGNFVRAI